MSGRRPTQPPTTPDLATSVDKHAASSVRDAANIVDNTSPQEDRAQIEKLCRLPPYYSRVTASRALRAVHLTGVKASLDELAAAADLPPEPPRAVEKLMAAWARAGAAPTGEHVRGPDGRWTMVWAAQTPPASVVAEAQATDERWQRLDALRPAARWAADLARRAGQWADDAWIGAAEEETLRERAKAAAEAFEPPICSRAAREGRALTSAERRRISPAAQLAALRKRAKASRQFWGAALQLTGGPASARRPRFADDYSLGCHLDRKEHAKEYGEKHVWIRDDGERFSAWDIMQAADVANLNRLYVQMRGIDDVALAVGLDAAMITLSLEPKWHPNPAVGECSWTMNHTPDRADRALQKLWERVRSRLGHADVTVLGLRVTEGHGDGCPHLHALLYGTAAQIDEIDATLRAVRPDDWDELPTDQDRKRDSKRVQAEKAARRAAKAATRADRRRRGLKMRVATDILRIDRARAKPTTYALKYILESLNVDPKKAFKAKGLDRQMRKEIKNAVNNIPVAADLRKIEPDDGDQIRDWERHRALASERRWHRYSILGACGMQKVWQRLVRLSEPDEGAPPKVIETWNAVQAHPAMSAAWAAMRGRRWDDALVALGAIRHPAVCDKDAPRAKLIYEAYENSYGEPARRPVGIKWSDDDFAIRLSDRTWTLAKVGEEGKEPVASPAPTARPVVQVLADGTRYDAETGEILDAPTANPLISDPRTVDDSCPREGADADHPDAAQVLYLTPPAHAGPPPAGPPRPRRGGMIGYIAQIDDLDDAA